eukprot:5030328-Prymnesium_polylepis.2
MIERRLGRWWRRRVGSHTRPFRHPLSPSCAVVPFRPPVVGAGLGDPRPRVLPLRQLPLAVALAHGGPAEAERVFDVADRFPPRVEVLRDHAHSNAVAREHGPGDQHVPAVDAGREPLRGARREGLALIGDAGTVVTDDSVAVRSSSRLVPLQQRTACHRGGVVTRRVARGASGAAPQRRA